MNYDLTISRIVKNRWKNSQIKSIKRLVKGYKFPVLDVVIENPNKEIIIKIVEDKVFEKRGYLEINVIKLLLKRFSEFPVPRIIKFDDSKQLIDFPYIIEEKIQGYDLADIDISSIKNKKEFVISFAKYAGQMNSITFKDFGYFDEELKIKTISWFDLIIEEISRYVDKIEKNEFLNKKTIEKVKQYIEKNKYLMKIKNKPRFIHNDYHGSNIKVGLVDGRCEITGIFDFEICMSGDPVRELYKAEWVLSKLPSYRKYFYQEYSKYVKLPKDYKKRLEFYELLGRLKHVQYRKKFETSSKGKRIIKEGVEIIKSIVK
ncbi:MAG: aminoglycoside phosphotransferase family protein [Nanoarchaeota archaeon]|nr:aminoglycoside phosphotransferase family protein [Nanoarchaeota archaeon]